MMGRRMQLKAGPISGSSRFRLRYSAECYSPTRIFWILPGFAGGSPLGRASTCSMPSITSPHNVYWRSRNVASSTQMKNWLFSLFGLAERAIEQDRKSVVLGNGLAGRVDLGVIRFIKKK